MFPVDLRREGSKGNLEVSLIVEDVVAIMVRSEERRVGKEC